MGGKKGSKTGEEEKVWHSDRACQCGNCTTEQTESSYIPRYIWYLYFSRLHAIFLRMSNACALAFVHEKKGGLNTWYREGKKKGVGEGGGSPFIFEQMSIP